MVHYTRHGLCINANWSIGLVYIRDVFGGEKTRMCDFAFSFFLSFQRFSGYSGLDQWLWVEQSGSWEAGRLSSCRWWWECNHHFADNSLQLRIFYVQIRINYGPFIIWNIVTWAGNAEWVTGLALSERVGGFNCRLFSVSDLKRFLKWYGFICACWSVLPNTSCSAATNFQQLTNWIQLRKNIPNGQSFIKKSDLKSFLFRANQHQRVYM